MVIHYPPARPRHRSDQPTAITNLLVATSRSFSTGIGGEGPIPMPPQPLPWQRPDLTLSP
jgi:hypothetical protein